MRRALIFDCDGVLSDTERDGHRVAFNAMWAEFGVPWAWSVEAYGRALKIGGGKERMGSLFSDPEFLKVFTPPSGAEERRELLAIWHARKSALYQDMVRAGRLPARSGVQRLAREAIAAGWLLGVASTSAQASVEAVLRHVVGETTAAQFAVVLAGDVVSAKKPAPDIYLLAAARLGVRPSDCVAIEDSRAGLLAAVAAGLTCIVTVSGYTRAEDFAPAALVLDGLGDPGGEVCHVLANRSAACPEGVLTAHDLERVLGEAIDAGPNASERDPA